MESTTAGAIFGVIGFLALAYAAYQTYRGSQSASWPTADGSIQGTDIHRDVDHDDDGSRDVTYTPRITYAYTVNGNTYTGDRITFGGTSSHHSRRRAEEELRKYENQQPLNVHYNPDDPGDAVLEAGIHWQFTIVMSLIGVVFLGIGIYATVTGGA